jgi:hypothetical protein
MNEHEALQAAVRDALYAFMGAHTGPSGRRWSVNSLAEAMGRPYDSTRNYLTGERSMPMEFFLDAALTLGVKPDEIVRDARERHLEKYLKTDSSPARLFACLSHRHAYPVHVSPRVPYRAVDCTANVRH